MKRTLLACLTICLVSPLQAQDSAPAPSSPPPLPPPPWVKRTPEFAQWVIVFTQSGPGAKPSSAAHAPKPEPGFDRKYIVATKTPGVLSETLTLQNRSVITRYFTHGVSLVQIDGKGPWISSGAGVAGGFNVANYQNSDFAGFDWLSAKNYAGTQEIAKKTCLVFRDKVLTLDPQEAEDMRTNADNARRDWKDQQQLKQSHPATSPPPAKAKGKAPTAAASPTPESDDPEPRAFNVDDYKTEVTAYVDAENGMPALLTYKTPQGETETRSYIFPPAPTDPLTIPPEAQKLIDQNQTRLKRISSSAAVP